MDYETTEAHKTPHSRREWCKHQGTKQSSLLSPSKITDAMKRVLRKGVLSTYGGD